MEKNVPPPSDYVQRLLAELPDKTSREKAEASLAKLPSVSIHGTVEYMAVTMSGPITFPAPTSRRRKQ